jgi:hypothetical protein
MMEYYKKSLPITVGTFFSLLCIISLIEFVRNIDAFDFSYTVEALPFLALSVVSGFIGIPLFFYGLEKVADKNG